MKNIFSDIGINLGDKILVSSDILKLLIKYKNKKEKFDPNFIIDMLLERVGKSGTLIFPTFNWDFCKGKDYDYKKTKSNCGSLTNLVLDRKDFLRTKNPVYSFAVSGKDRDFICEMKHKNCFGLDSPFGYLINNNGKNLFIDVHYREGGFPFVHVAEQEAGVKYRFLKKFSGNYIGLNNKKSKINCLLYVRDKKLNVGRTLINKRFDETLKKINAYRELVVEDTFLSIMDIKKAYELLVKDLKNKGNLIYNEI